MDINSVGKIKNLRLVKALRGQSLTIDLGRTYAAAAGKDASSAMQTLKPSLERLATIYQSMQQQCATERDVLAAKLNEVNTGRSATEHYASTSSL